MWSYLGRPTENCVKEIQQLQICLELVSKESNHLAAILHVYAGGLNFMK